MTQDSLFHLYISTLLCKKFKFKETNFLMPSTHMTVLLIYYLVWYEKKTQNYIIKNKRIFKKMINGKKILAVIPARAGSISVKDKNIRKLNGKTLIEIAYKCLKR